MSPSILIVGSTGNTGAELVRTLPKLLHSHPTLSSHRILALTRNAKGSVAQEFARIKNVEVIEKNWVYIDEAWLREHSVERVYIASHNGATHFTDESLFLVAALNAGVKYLVRLSTTTSNVGPTTNVMYGRGHWALENLLSQPEFGALQWTSLQPNMFISYLVPGPIEWVKSVKAGKQQEPLRMMLDKEHGSAIVDSSEVGNAAAHLLALDDPSPHNGQKYIINAPSDITGQDVVDLVEKYAGAKVENVVFADEEWIKFAGEGFPDYLHASLLNAPKSTQRGETSVKVAPTSEALAKVYKPKNGPKEALEAALKAL